VTRDSARADVLDVAAAIVDVASATGDDDLTTMKLQKLVYYVQAWHLADHGTPLFDEPIEAWPEGPVVRRLWQHHRGARRVHGFRFGSADQLSPEDRALVEEVVDRYGRLSGDALSELTHAERPWKTARGDLSPRDSSNDVIDPEIMRASYRRGSVSAERAVSFAIANNRLEGLAPPVELLPDLYAVATGERSADEVIAEQLAAVFG
jgi:uncharacterized phage-associated protein